MAELNYTGENNLDETIEFISTHTGGAAPDTGIILGTGLGGLVHDIEIKHRIDYENIPHFPLSTVESHHGNLIFGKISSHDAVIMQGRFHFYEGYSMPRVTYPIRLMQALGINTLLVSNACGALNPSFRAGDLMIMTDHINLFFDTPLKHTSLDKYNKRIYDRGLIRLAEAVALENNIPLKKGIYCALRGPCLETAAEYRLLRKLGGDVVGMSTIPEALMCSSDSIRVLGFSIITDVGFPDSLKPATITEILKTASEAEPKMTLLMKKILEKL